MAWQDRYVPGSFRGVGFVTQRHEHPFGRAVDPHEYPESEAGWSEDLGRRLDRWSLTIFVIGDDYMTGRDALLAALKAPGAATLVHPYLGTFQAQFIDGRLTESTDEGGMARFEVEFVEPGIVVTAQQAPDTQAASAEAADATDASATDRFADVFQASGEPPFVDDAAVSVIGSILSSVSGIAVTLGGAGVTLRAFQAGLSALGGAASLIGSPANLAAVVIGLVGALGALGSRPTKQVGALRSVIGAASALPPIAATTSSRAQQAINQQAIADLVILAAAGAAVRSAADAGFSSYDDAVALRDALGDDLDDQALAAAGRGNPALAADLDTLRRTMIADVTARGGSLAHLFSYTPSTVLPALVIAWQLYRDPTSTIEQAAEIVARNAIRHPGFVPVAPLQVLTAAASSADV